MPFGDFGAWRRELLWTGELVQDSDTSVPEEEAGYRFDRYVEPADMVDGTEGPTAVQALIASLRAEEGLLCQADVGPCADWGRFARQ
ncbi:hypothetical protein [Streptomyces sp. NPDC020951]|uniref:hypothetical protein n=1 Tax=Streptomyces sp. NPDC020951 TaxID=3365104 RepID=UPI0037A5D1CD